MGGWTDNGLMDVGTPKRCVAPSVMLIQTQNMTALSTSHLKGMMVQLVSKQVLENIKKKI